MLVTCRCHYSIDIVGGLVWGLFWFRCFERITVWIDKIFSLPYRGGRWVYFNLCADDEEREEEEMKEEKAAKTTGRESKRSDNI